MYLLSVGELPMAEKLLFGASVADDAQVNQHFIARRDTALEFQTALLCANYTCHSISPF